MEDKAYIQKMLEVIFTECSSKAPLFRMTYIKSEENADKKQATGKRRKAILTKVLLNLLNNSSFPNSKYFSDNSV